MIICTFTFGAGNSPEKCVNQHLSAIAHVLTLDTRGWLVSVMPCVLYVRDYWKGRADNTASTDRRRQSCRTPSKPSWPLASSQFSLLVHSRKSPWKSPWSWKKKLWKSSDLELSRSGLSTPRLNPCIGALCNISRKFLSFWSWPHLHVSSPKRLYWSCHSAQTADPGSFPARPFGVDRATPTFGRVPC